jgi:hypothetical protein
MINLIENTQLSEVTKEDKLNIYILLAVAAVTAIHENTKMSLVE